MRTPLAARVLMMGIVAATVVGATPAHADSAEPSHYLSTVTGLEPDVDGVVFDVIGGDAFLEVEVGAGHEVLIPGYFGEPYVRIDGDGSVWVNDDSQAAYLNEDRYARVLPPPDADGTGDPRWRLVDDDGRYAWHDHRTHWMALDRPPGVGGDERQLVFPWRIPIEVDGREVTVTGELEWLPSQSPVPAALIGLAGLLPLLAGTHRRRVAAAALAAAAFGALIVALAQYAGTPALARVFPVGIVFPLVGLGAAIAALVVRRPRSATWALLAAALTAVAWAAMTLEVLWLPVLIATIPAGVERVAVSLILGAGIAGLAVWGREFVRLLHRPAQR